MASTNQIAPLPTENGEKIIDGRKGGSPVAAHNDPIPGYSIQKPEANLTYDDYSILQKELKRLQRLLAKWEASDLSSAGIGWYRDNVMHLVAVFEERQGRK